VSLTPFRAFLLKVASRCNLDCDYCYVYHRADQSWRQQPRRMSLATAAQIGRRINEHARSHDLSTVDVVLHGGEPLLLGLPYLGRLMAEVATHAPDVALTWGGQTNGTLFDAEALAFCRRHRLRLGLSVDGPAEVNNRHRLDHAGRSSYDAVSNALNLLSSEEGREVWGGLLAVIDVRSDPVAVYQHLSSYRPGSIDFLLPLGHHDQRPPGKESLTSTPYADWLLEIFRVWYAEKPQPIMIRRFRDIIAQLFGIARSSEEWGLQAVDFTVIETNGEIQAVDTLKVTYPGACRLGLDIFRHSFDDALQAPLVRQRQESWSHLSDICRECDLVTVCGGGYFPHRYSVQRQFLNPSVYCADLMKLIREIAQTVRTDIARLTPSASTP
jgi:uncharacterized protein